MTYNSKHREILYTALLSISVSGVFAQTKAPNIIIIHTDEQNFRTLGCYRECLQNEQAFPWGEKAVVETPNIDYLAHHGVLFTRCYSTSPVSSPSRASFMTGLYPQNNGVWTNDMVLSEKVETFGESLRKNGYTTGYFGKLHINGKGRPEWHPKRDYGFSDNNYMYNRGHWKKIEETPEGPVFRTQADVRSTDEETFPTDYFTNKAIEFINQQKEHLFCCMLCFPDPHSANLVRPPYDTMYNQIKFKEPVTVLADTTGRPAWSHGNNLPADQPEDMAQYFGMIKCIDDNVGRIMKTLQDADILSNTIIIFTSDHGDMCRQHGLINKGVPLDDSARIPFIISYPTGMRQGIRVENVMSVTDFTPSLLSFCNISSETPYDGRDLSVLWKGNKLPAQYKDIVFMRAVTHKIESDWDESATAKRTMWISAVTPDYKLTYSEYASDIPWLTDLKKDPDELVNCYFDPAYKEIVSRLASDLKEYGAQYNDPRIHHPKIQSEISSAIFKR